MKKKLTTAKYLLLVFAGIVLGAVVFSNLEFRLGSEGFTLSAKPNYATAKNNFENYPIQTLKSFNEAFVQIAESATPSVVTVFTEKKMTERVIIPFNFFGNPFDDMFGNSRRTPGNGSGNVKRGLGSGVIVTEDGYILTNNHVIDGADQIYVRTSDNRRIDAKIVGKDPKTDLAVIKVNAKGLKPLPFGDSDRLRVGEWVIAIGSPLGESLARTVTQGIVSAKGRANVGLADYEDFIQTDAAINPGNSGGPLININGELVGINTAIASRTGGFEGIGFAVPSNMARQVLTSLITTGKVSRGYLGVTLQDIDDNLAKGLRLQKTEGVLVGTVVEGSPAQKGGIRTGDVLLEFNSNKITDSAELRNWIAAQAPGTAVTLKGLRDGRPVVFQVRLDPLPAKELAGSQPQPQAGAVSALGFHAEELTAQTAVRFNLKQGEGKVVITAVEPSSNAAMAGIRPGDVILSVNRQPVASFAAYSALVKSVREGDLLFLLVERGGNRIYFAYNV
ncbi:MAG: DegQ family serine endoprotease [Chlorobiaceae bacterium]|nr:DegQ family serine endoprotease [Chlorobiaceae bacterium]